MPKSKDRQARLAEALRANLKRRKVHGRAAAATAAEPADGMAAHGGPDCPAADTARRPNPAAKPI